MRPENFYCLLQILTSNALDWMKGEESPRIRLTLRGMRDRCELIFSDSGPGIPFELAEKVFEPLFSRKEGGRGMGLTIARQMVEAHGGRIGVITDARRRGANFLVTLTQKAIPGNELRMTPGSAGLALTGERQYGDDRAMVQATGRRRACRLHRPSGLDPGDCMAVDAPVVDRSVLRRGRDVSRVPRGGLPHTGGHRRGRRGERDLPGKFHAAPAGNAPPFVPPPGEGDLHDFDLDGIPGRRERGHRDRRAALPGVLPHRQGEARLAA